MLASNRHYTCLTKIEFSQVKSSLRRKFSQNFLRYLKCFNFSNVYIFFLIFWISKVRKKSIKTENFPRSVKIDNL